MVAGRCRDYAQTFLSVITLPVSEWIYRGHPVGPSHFHALSLLLVTFP